MQQIRKIHYLPSPENVCPSNSMAILKTGAWTGPVLSINLYSKPGLSSFKAKHGFFSGWNADLFLLTLLTFAFFFLPGVANNSGNLGLFSEKRKN